MNIIFAGTPAFAETALSALIAAGHHLTLVLTQPDRPAGRGMQVQISEVKRRALAHGLPLYQPKSLKSAESWEPIRAAGAEVMVVAAYGLILPQEVLDLPERGCLNIHASLLPRWRGAAPIQRAIEAGDEQTGITIMQMDAGLDTGAMLLRSPIPINPLDNASTLHDRLADLGARSIVQVLGGLKQYLPEAQDNSMATYAQKLQKAEGALDWRLSAGLLARRIRAFDPFPGCSSRMGDQVLKIWAARVVNGIQAEPGQIIAIDHRVRVACGEGALDLLEMQRPGGKRLAVNAFLAGCPLNVGDRFELPDA